jgi:CMP-N-acetylneuraminic acid synthetase
MDFVIAVHAKEKSERIPYKNVKVLGNQPLYAHALETATKVKGTIEGLGHSVTVVMDSDSPQYRAYAKHYFGAEAIERPPQLVTSKATGDHLAQWQVGNYPNSDVLVQLVPTSPFIKPETVVEGMMGFINKEVKYSIMGVTLERGYYWMNGQCNYLDEKGHIKNSQDIAPILKETTGLYMVKSSYVKRFGRRSAFDKSQFLELTPVEAVDINNPGDWELAELVWKGMNK